jgi:hypothetical protein
MVLALILCRSQALKDERKFNEDMDIEQTKRPYSLYGFKFHYDIETQTGIGTGEAYSLLIQLRIFCPAD